MSYGLSPHVTSIREINKPPLSLIFVLDLDLIECKFSFSSNSSKYYYINQRFITLISCLLLYIIIKRPI